MHQRIPRMGPGFVSRLREFVPNGPTLWFFQPLTRTPSWGFLIVFAYVCSCPFAIRLVVPMLCWIYTCTFVRCFFFSLAPKHDAAQKKTQLPEEDDISVTSRCKPLSMLSLSKFIHIANSLRCLLALPTVASLEAHCGFNHLKYLCGRGLHIKCNMDSFKGIAVSKILRCTHGASLKGH